MKIQISINQKAFEKSLEDINYSMHGSETEAKRKRVFKALEYLAGLLPDDSETKRSILADD